MATSLRWQAWREGVAPAVKDEEKEQIVPGGTIDDFELPIDWEKRRRNARILVVLVGVPALLLGWWFVWYVGHPLRIYEVPEYLEARGLKLRDEFVFLHKWPGLYLTDESCKMSARELEAYQVARGRSGGFALPAGAVLVVELDSREQADKFVVRDWGQFSRGRLAFIGDPWLLKKIREKLQ